MEATSAPVVAGVGAHGRRSVVELAAAEAVRGGSTLHLVHAVDVDHVSGTAGADEARRREREGVDLLAAAVQHGTALVSGLVPVTATLARSAAVPALASAGHRARLVVVGRCPESRRTHPYVRSVTGGVAARATAPVVSVPEGWEEGSAAQRVVVGIDEPDRSADVVAAALAAARARRARLTVMCTWWRPVGSGYSSLTQVSDLSWPERLEEGLDRVLAGVRAEYEDVPVEIHVRNARPGDALIDASRTADLVVLGRHASLVPDGSHLGPVARAVVREALCPVLLAVPSRHHWVAPLAGRSQPLSV